MDTNLLFGPLGTLAAALVAVSAFVSGRVITRSQHLEALHFRDEIIGNLRAERSYWRQLALSGTSLAAKATELAVSVRHEQAAKESSM